MLRGGGISAEGFGLTAEDAISDSRNNLIRSFSVNVTTLTYTSDSDDGQGNTSSGFDEMSVQSVSFELLGQREEVEQLPDGTYKAVTTLPESSAQLYSFRLNDLYPAISQMYETVKGAAEKSSVKSLYLQLISLLREYELYRTVLFVLSPTGYSVQTLPTSSAAIEAEYQSLLMAENNNLDITIMDYQQQAELGILSVRDQAALDEAIKTLEENRKQQAELQKQRQDEYQMKLLEMQQQFDLYVSQAQIDPELISEQKEEGVSLSGIINRIEANRNTFQTIKESLESELHDNQVEYEAKLAEYLRNGMGRPYSSSEMAGGAPTQIAIENRRTQLINEFNATEGVYYQGVADAIYSEAFGRLSAIANSTLDYIDLINGKSFSFSSNDDEVSTVIEYFTPNNNSWVGSADVTIGNQTIELYFVIPYTGWTGESIPDQKSDPLGYSAFLDETSAWLDILSNYPSSYFITFNFDVEADASSSDYRIVFSNYEIKRSDTGETAIRAGINQTNSISYGVGGNVMDFLVDSMDLVELSKYRFVRSSESTVTEDLAISHASDKAPEEGLSWEEQDAEAAAMTSEVFARRSESLYELGRYQAVLEASYLMPSNKQLGLNWSIGINAEFSMAVGQSLYLGLGVTFPLGFSDAGMTGLMGDGNLVYGTGASITWLQPIISFLDLSLKVSGGALFYGGKPDISFYAGADAGLLMNFDSFGILLSASVDWFKDRLLFGGTVGAVLAFGR